MSGKNNCKRPKQTESWNHPLEAQVKFDSYLSPLVQEDIPIYTQFVWMFLLVVFPKYPKSKLKKEKNTW